jgi:hypothetical protein
MVVGVGCSFSWAKQLDWSEWRRFDNIDVGWSDGWCSLAGQSFQAPGCQFMPRSASSSEDWLHGPHGVTAVHAIVRSRCNALLLSGRHG